MQKAVPSVSRRSRTRFASAGRCRDAICTRGGRIPSSFLVPPAVGLCASVAELVTLWSRAGSRVVHGRVRERQLCGVNGAPGACSSVRRGRGQDQALISCPQSQQRGSLVDSTWGASSLLPVSSRSCSCPCPRCSQAPLRPVSPRRSSGRPGLRWRLFAALFVTLT